MKIVVRIILKKCLQKTLNEPKQSLTKYNFKFNLKPTELNVDYLKDALSFIVCGQLIWLICISILAIEKSYTLSRPLKCFVASFDYTKIHLD